MAAGFAECLSLPGSPWLVQSAPDVHAQVVEEENAARAGREAELASDLFARLHPGRRLELDVMHPEVEAGRAILPPLLCQASATHISAICVSEQCLVLASRACILIGVMQLQQWQPSEVMPL